MRFQKRIKILPGLRLNLSLKGVSASVGPRGASLNISKRGTRLTAGIPGTGLSHTEVLTRTAKQPEPPQFTSVDAVAFARKRQANNRILAAIAITAICVLVVWLLAR